MATGGGTVPLAARTREPEGVPPLSRSCCRRHHHHRRHHHRHRHSRRHRHAITATTVSAAHTVGAAESSHEASPTRTTVGGRRATGSQRGVTKVGVEQREGGAAVHRPTPRAVASARAHPRTAAVEAIHRTLVPTAMSGRGRLTCGQGAENAGSNTVGELRSVVAAGQRGCERTRSSRGGAEATQWAPRRDTEATGRR